MAEHGRGPHPLPLFLALAARTAGPDRQRLADILAGLRIYQQAALPPEMPPCPLVARCGGVMLRHVGGPPDAPATVVIPSLINAPVVLDLAEGRSLVRYLASQGHRVLLVDWGPMRRSERRLGLAGLVSVRLLPLLARLEGPLRLVGYCLGGTLALAAGQLLGARLERLALIASPWHFDGFPDQARRNALESWRAIRLIGDRLGAVPVSLLNPLFWSLDEAAVVEKFARLGRRPPGDPHIGWFAAVEDWANSGAPLTRAAARDLFLSGFGADRIGRGEWRVGGEAIRPDAIRAALFEAGATRDRIVPQAARLRRPVDARIDVPSGHVGMVVGGGARAGLWEPLSNWLHGA
ncbi:MAG: alpha/beta hydrolase [Sphingomonadaceae bacterium]